MSASQQKRIMTTDQTPRPGPGRPLLGAEPKTDRLVVRTEGWRVAGCRLAAKRSGTTFARFVEEAVDDAARKQGVEMPPKG